ncbi:hypothetical protein AB1L88_22780 [Tautonia sp. JC769]|uniref:hypothetical protein n=1 Tax=Tautonia sp. JC769 TaxID=3232135 RepID=UPI00345A3C41
MRGDHPIRTTLAPLSPPVALAALLLSLPGCGPAPDQGGVAVTGQVLLDGQPLDEAHITLIPESSGPAVTGVVQGGAFRIPPSEGPEPGPYRVEIDAVRPTGRIIEHPDLLGQTAEETENIVPPRFNRASTLRVEVGDGGDNHFEFAVTTR